MMGVMGSEDGFGGGGWCVRRWRGGGRRGSGAGMYGEMGSGSAADYMGVGVAAGRLDVHVLFGIQTCSLADTEPRAMARAYNSAACCHLVAVMALLL